MIKYINTPLVNFKLLYEKNVETCQKIGKAAGVCMETGAMCEAQKYNLKVTHSLCISRENEKEAPKILTACGICQERLWYWGNQVKVAVTNADNKIIFKSLKELSDFYWGEAFEESLKGDGDV